MTEPDAETAAPTTLSGRPAIEVGAARSRTRLRWTTKVGAGLFAVAVVAAVGLAVLRAGPEGTDVRQLPPGTCYVATEVVTDHGRAVPYGKDAPCLPSAPRVVAVLHLTGSAYPGIDALNQEIADGCGGEHNHVIAPTPESWLDGDRTIACLRLP